MTTRKRHLDENAFNETMNSKSSSIKVSGITFNYQTEELDLKSSFDALKHKLADQSLIELKNCTHTIKQADKNDVYQLQQSGILLPDWLVKIQETHPKEIELLNEAILEHIQAVKDAKLKTKAIKVIKGMTKCSQAVLSIWTAFLIKICSVAKENYDAVMMMTADWIYEAATRFQQQAMNTNIIELMANQVDSYISSSTVEIKQFLPDELIFLIDKDMQKLLLDLMKQFFNLKTQQ